MSRGHQLATESIVPAAHPIHSVSCNAKKKHTIHVPQRKLSLNTDGAAKRKWKTQQRWQHNQQQTRHGLVTSNWYLPGQKQRKEIEKYLYTIYIVYT